MRKILLASVLSFFTASVFISVSYAFDSDSEEEKQAFIDATVEATCFIAESEDISDLLIENYVKEIYEKYGFDSDDEVAMDTLMEKYGDDENVQSAVNEALDKCAMGLLIDNPFTDLSESHKNYNAIIYLYANDVINGYPDGTFKPENEINRAELLTILIQGQGFDPSSSVYENCFFDVKDDWYAPFVCYAKEQGWVDGYPDGSFKPSQTVNKVEAIKMLLNSQGIDVPESVKDDPFSDVASGEWFAPFVFVAKDMGILEEEGAYFKPAEFMVRAGICENLYRLLIL